MLLKGDFSNNGHSMNGDLRWFSIYLNGDLRYKSGNYRVHKSLDVFCDKFSRRIKDKYVVHTFVYCNDMYEKENESDKNHSYVEFASEKIEEIRNLLSIIGKHVYNKQEGEYVYLKIE